MTPVVAAAPVTVYIMRAADGTPLYIGCTSRFLVRPAEHRYEPWYREVVSVDFEHYEDRPTGFARERQLIWELQPSHNPTKPSEDPSAPTAPKPTSLARVQQELARKQRKQARRRRLELVLAEYLTGKTLQEVGDSLGVTRERVRQLLAEGAPPWLLAWERERRATRTRVRRAANRFRTQVEASRACRTCGGPVLPRSGGSITCEGECHDIFLALRQHLIYKRVAQLKGRGRWLVAGSSAWDAAEFCLDRHYPIFDELPEDIQRQVRGELRSWERSSPRSRCAACGEPTTNPRFCSQECYYASGRVGQKASA